MSTSFDKGIEKDLTLSFANARAAYHFKLWLCESGEQRYWEWMSYREDEEDGNITAKNFNYFTGNSTIETE